MHVQIPFYKQIGDKGDKKPFTAFCIEVHDVNVLHIVYKRYKEFEKLNATLVERKIEVPTFPNKSVLKWNQKILEHRRQVFEKYLNYLLNMPIIPAEVLIFLKIDFSKNVKNPPKSSDESNQNLFSEHVISFTETFQILPHLSGFLEDNIVAGVLQAYQE